MNELLLLLLPLSAFTGWWLARTDKKSDSEQKADDYFKGLGYLLEDETDKAIDIFVRIAHLDDSTVENQITLGNLFRHRGEIDRALHIHSSLCAKDSLAPATQQKLHLALADDYLAAGIMNHAESYFQTVRESTQSDMRDIARRKLMTLYAEQSQWEKAIELGVELDPFKRDSVQKKIAHYHCEIAKNALASDNLKAAEAELKKALQCDKYCVRASIKLGRLAASQGNYVAAIGSLTLIEQQNSAFLPEVLPDLADCYSALNQQHEWKDELQRLSQSYHNPVLMLAFNQLIADTEGGVAARDFLQQRLQEKPNMLAVQAYLKLADAGNDKNADIQLLNESIDRVLSYALKYRCSECGFRGNQLNWHCPGCKNWGTFTPVSDISVNESIG